ncbi:MAG: DUF4143 domain-containing protein [Bacillus subtilis]|nr:DUF4143 domain-containing protein [Bacillus subtilis]
MRQIQNVKDLTGFRVLYRHCCGESRAGIQHSRPLQRPWCDTSPRSRHGPPWPEASYLCHFLPPYFRNYGKRIIKTPKFYFLDTALVCMLTRQPDPAAALAGAMAGALFEGMIASARPSRSSR